MPAGLVHLELGDIAAILIGGEEPVARRIETDVARGTPAGGHVFQMRQPAGGAIDGKDRDAARRQAVLPATFVRFLSTPGGSGVCVSDRRITLT